MNEQVEKLFDVACALIDVMPYVAMQQSAFESRAGRSLQRFIYLISGLCGGQSRYLSALACKIKEVLPDHAHEFIHSVPPPVSCTLPWSTPNFETNQLYEGSIGQGIPRILPENGFWP